MLHRNFLTQPLEPLEGCHDGVGVLRHREVIGGKDFQADIRFLNYTVLPPGTSIGLHRHGNDQELYIVLAGHGEMELDGRSTPPSPGTCSSTSPTAPTACATPAGRTWRYWCWNPPARQGRHKEKGRGDPPFLCPAGK